jgi:hypothetical protein
MDTVLLRVVLVLGTCSGCGFGQELGRDLVRAEIVRASARHGVDPGLAQAVAKRESGMQPGVVSAKGAVGVMQLMPRTAMGLRVNPWDVRQNIDGGVRYLASLLARYGGDVRAALAAYNAGPGVVDRSGGVPPYTETRSYVGAVMLEYAGSRQGGSRAGESLGGGRGKRDSLGQDPCSRAQVVKGMDGRWMLMENRRRSGCSVMR